jgi:hypothetical protein
MNMDKDLEQKMMNYIDALEKTIDQLVFALKSCVELIGHLKPIEPDEEKWRSMLDDLEGIIRVGERITDQNPLG